MQFPNSINIPHKCPLYLASLTDAPFNMNKSSVPISCMFIRNMYNDNAST